MSGFRHSLSEQRRGRCRSSTEEIERPGTAVMQSRAEDAGIGQVGHDPPVSVRRSKGTKLMDSAEEAFGFLVEAIVSAIVGTTSSNISSGALARAGSVARHDRLRPKRQHGHQTPWYRWCVGPMNRQRGVMLRHWEKRLNQILEMQANRDYRGQLRRT